MVPLMVAPASDRFCDGASQWIGGPITAAGCEAHDQLSSAVGAVGGDVLNGFANAVAGAVAKVFQTATSFWVQVPTPGVVDSTCQAQTSGCEPTPNDTLAFLWAHLSWFCGLMLVASVLVGAARTAWSQRKEPIVDLAKSLVTFVVASTAGVSALGLAIQAGDEFSTWIVTDAAGPDLGRGIIDTATISQLGVALVIVLGIVGIILGLVQLILMILRLAVLTLMLGFLPLSASATNTGFGRTWFQRTVSWTVAFVLYKPIAAVIYAAAYKLMSADMFSDEALLSFATGLAMLVLAVLALPATMKAIAPAMASVSSSTGVGAVMAMGASGAAMISSGGTAAAAGAGSAGSNLAAGGTAARQDPVGARAAVAPSAATAADGTSPAVPRETAGSSSAGAAQAVAGSARAIQSTAAWAEEAVEVGDGPDGSARADREDQ
jgi:type IV secretion system protein TrbL